MTRTRRLPLLLVLLLLVAGCDARTAFSGDAAVRLQAVFDDASNLVPGHAVRAGDVVVGRVSRVELDDDLRALITFSVDRPVPRGTRAHVRQMSLLGEHFLDLEFPADRGGGAVLAEGDLIAETTTDATLEDVASEAIVLLDALITDDMAALIDSASTVFGDRGEQLHRLVQQVGEVSAVYAAQNEDIAAAIDHAGAFGADLAVGSEELGSMIDELSGLVTSLSRNRDLMITTAGDLTEVAAQVEEELLAPHADDFRSMLDRARPLLAALAAEQDAIGALIDGAVTFIDAIDGLVVDDQLQGFARLGEMRPDPAQRPSPIDRFLDPFPNVPPIEDRSWVDRLLEQLR